MGQRSNWPSVRSVVNIHWKSGKEVEKPTFKVCIAANIKFKALFWWVIHVALLRVHSSSNIFCILMKVPSGNSGLHGKWGCRIMDCLIWWEVKYLNR